MSDNIEKFELFYLKNTFIKTSFDYIWQEDKWLCVDMSKALTDNYKHTIKAWGFPRINDICDWLEDLEGVIKEELDYLEYKATHDYAYILVEDDHISDVVAECGGNEENYHDELWDVREWLDVLHSEVDATYYPLIASLIADTLRGASAVGVPVT